MRVKWMLPLLLAVCAAGGHAADDPDAAALSLADNVANGSVRARDWQAFVEVAAGGAANRNGGGAVHNQRLSFDLQLDQSFAKGWRAVLADRLDVNWQGSVDNRNEINTLKEAYLSWQPRDDLIADAGRINARYGLAIGYNPTDYFRAGALRSVVSVDPASLKRNRQGSVMLRGQALWTGGSLSAMLSPKLASQGNNAAFHPDWGATNFENRLLLAWSQQIAPDFNPQWLLYKQEGSAPQFGANITKLLNDATVAYLEWSGGKSASLLAQSLDITASEAFHHRLSTGLTYTTSAKLSVTFEYQYNGAALDRAAWNALRAGPLPVYGRYRQWIQANQELPTRHALFLYAAWQDALISRLDLAAMLRFNREDRSRLSWFEARYRWPQDEIALQLQRNSGAPGSEYGAFAQRDAWQAVYRHFF